MNMNHFSRRFALDTESTYEKGRDIQALGVQNYVRHPETVHFMVSLYGVDGDERKAWAGPPEEAPWDLLNGALVYMHNAGYDLSVLEELERRGITLPKFGAVVCTADMAAQMNAPRDLAGASAELLGVALDKSTRNKFKNVSIESLRPGLFGGNDLLLEITKYALYDAKATFLLGEEFAKTMSEFESRLSSHTRKMTRRGIRVDLDGLKTGMNHLRNRLFDVAKDIPWADSGEPPTSPKQLAAACRKAGIPVPESTAKNDLAFQEWADTYGSAAPFVAAVAQHRSINKTLVFLESLEARLVHDRLPYGLKYYGASATGRWSGENALNMLNLARDVKHDVDVRALFIPKDGHVFVSADAGQIEPRISAWQVGDKDQLRLMRDGVDVYEIVARRMFGFREQCTLKEAAKKDPKFARLRQFAKAVRLGLTYGQYAAGFQAYAKLSHGLEMTLDEAKQHVKDFRKAEPLLVRFWERMFKLLCDSKNDSLELELPSGRHLRYLDVKTTAIRKSYQARGATRYFDAIDVNCRREMGGEMTYMTEGKLHNNICQGIARDFLAHAVLRIEDEFNWPVVLHVYDEVLVEVPEHKAEQAVKDVTRAMTEPPSWMSQVPLATDCKIIQRYEK